MKAWTQTYIYTSKSNINLSIKKTLSFSENKNILQGIGKNSAPQDDVHKNIY